jgi:hypothetical protein
MKFRGLFGGSPPDRDQETSTLIAEVEELRKQSEIATAVDQLSLISAIIEDVGEKHDATLGMRIGAPIVRIVKTLMSLEQFAYEPPTSAEIERMSLSAKVELRKQLRETKRMLEPSDQYVLKWAGAVVGLLTLMYNRFPPQAFVDPDENGNFEEMSVLAPSAPLYTYIDDLPKLVYEIPAWLDEQRCKDGGLFADIVAVLRRRICLASGIDPDNPNQSKRYILADDKKGCTDEELVELYLGGTPFFDLLMTPIPLQIPEAVRFEHTYVLAGTGHGKTQTLQYLIAGDLDRAIRDGCSVVVMDGQGDLLRTLMQSDYFRSPALRDRFVYVDPTDIERPVGLNLFDVGLDQLGADVKPVVREQIQNATIELFEYFFGGLLGAELTQKQGVVFRYIAALMTHIPDANIHTLRELMEDGEKFKPYIKTLQGSTKAFFETRFFNRQFNETKKQILNRLWGVLSNASLDRMMSAKRNSVNLFENLQAGSVVFINTATDFFGQEGSAIFSRMFVALLSQALMRRAAVPKHERTPTYIYVDEAEPVIDLTLIRALATVRKFKGAFTFAHQNADQIEASNRAGVIANTSIKLIGGVSAKDARTLAEDMRTDADFILAQRRTATATQFACYAKNVTEKAVTLSIPLGYVESRPKLSASELSDLIEGSRERYGVPYGQEKETAEIVMPETLPVAAVPVQTARPSPQVELPETEGIEQDEDELPADSWKPPVHEPEEHIAITREVPRPVPVAERPMGGGGVKHKYLENLLKELGEERGFRVTLEEPIHDGAGRVDAVLVRGETELAFEISVTTTRDHELGNIEKCLALPYTHVVMLTSHARRQTSLRNFISEALEDKDKKRVSFLLPEDLPGFLDGYQPAQAPTERTVKGYTVRSRVKETSPEEALARRKAIAQVVARSIQADVST